MSKKVLPVLRVMYLLGATDSEYETAAHKLGCRWQRGIMISPAGEMVMASDGVFAVYPSERDFGAVCAEILRGADPRHWAKQL